MEYVGNTSAKYSLIIGNPPYINAKKQKNKVCKRQKIYAVKLVLKQV